MARYVVNIHVAIRRYKHRSRQRGDGPVSLRHQIPAGPHFDLLKTTRCSVERIILIDEDGECSVARDRPVSHSYAVGMPLCTG